MIFCLLLTLGLKSATAAAHIATSTGKSFFTASIISSALIIFFTFISLEKLIEVGPATSVVFTPNFDRAKAISYPCLPLDSLEIYLTGSKYSRVGPVVTKALIFFFLTKSLLSK